MGRAHEVRKADMAKTAAMKSAIYGRAAKEIYMAAKQGGTDPNANLALRSAIDKAKSKQVPTDTIERAIKKAAGADNESFISNRYEGYGPGNVAIIVDSLTSNVNRAIAEIKDVFKKNDGKIGVSGSVSHMFQATSVFAFEGFDVEAVLEYLMEADAAVNDVVKQNNLTFVYAPFAAFNQVRQTLDKMGVSEYKVAETTMLPNDEVSIDDEEKKKSFEKLIDRLNELEDVQDVYHNAA
ncbi:YebC/PmpR family DNA-binding transcriptional regulator [Spiroplasma alleghenense]|uniref:Probable transcriptional regulatory protein SALLE_v1c07670 n=1 Tax=Spiroplasma alleghenense TaxID=216931 RepID=A0A345Z4A8_9MOLU|nr:YebC/PmpR family DNA-binding transcriptional regulator [Spiroplasma alleghenense]AXK51437.1 YebC/PmpR family DNA-binding regulatory protein [Spiroplasma alleghenense]